MNSASARLLALPSLAIALLFAAPCKADQPDERLHPYVALDPLPYVLQGFSAHLGVQLPGNRFSFEAAIFKSNLGDTLLKLVEPSDQGFTANLKGLTAEGYWHPVIWGRNAFQIGLQAHFDQFDITRADDPGSARIDQIYLLPTVAYRFFPIDSIGLFFKPFAGLGVPILSTASARVGTHVYQQLAVFPLATVVIGYQF